MGTTRDRASLGEDTIRVNSPRGQAVDGFTKGAPKDSHDIGAVPFVNLVREDLGKFAFTAEVPIIHAIQLNARRLAAAHLESLPNELIDLLQRTLGRVRESLSDLKGFDPGKRFRRRGPVAPGVESLQ